MLIATNRWQHTFSPFLHFFLSTFLTKNWLVKKKEYGIKEKIRIKKYGIIMGLFSYPTFFHDLGLAGQYWETSMGNSELRYAGFV